MSDRVVTKRMKMSLEAAANRAFEAVFEAARSDDARNRIADARKMLKAVSVAPHIAKRANPDNKIPLVLHHWVTLRCNASCQQCLWKDNSAPQMNTEEIKRFYSDAAEAGIVSTLIGGGEPQLRKDIAEIYRFAKKECGWKVGTATNGAFIDRKFHEFGEYIDTMIISIDSAVPEKHDHIREVPGLFEKATNGIRMVKKDFPFIHLFINCCLNDNSADEVEDIIALAQELDVPVSFDLISTVQHTAEKGVIDKKSHLIGSYEKMAEAMHKVREAKKKGAKIFNSNHYLTHFDGGKKAYECRYPLIYLRVMPNGDVEDCMQIDKPIGNVLETPVKDILMGERMEEFRRNASRCSSCSSPAMVDTSYFFDNPLKLIGEFRHI